MKRHILCKEDFEEYEFEHQLAGSFGKGENKSLAVAVKIGGIPTYKVYKYGAIVVEFSKISSAIEAYNDI